MGSRGILVLAFVVGMSVVTNNVARANDFADVMEAKTDFERMLTERKLADAEIELMKAETQLKQAEAAKEYAEADFIREKISYLKSVHSIMLKEYARIEKEEAALKDKMYEVMLHQTLCGELADGQTRRGAFRCLNYFRRYLVSFNIQKKLLFDDKLEALPADEFVPNYSGMTTLPFAGGNVGQLLVFAERNDFSFAPFGKAHSFVMGFLDAMQVAAQAKVMEYRNWIDGIRAGTLDVYNPPN